MDQAVRFESELLGYVDLVAPGLPAEIEEAKELTPQLTDAMRSLLDKFSAQFAPDPKE